MGAATTALGWPLSVCAVFVPKPVERHLVCWQVLAKCTPIEDTAQINASVPEHHVHPLGAQIKVLLHKHAVLTLRDPAMYALRIGAFIFVSFFFGVLYWDSRKENQDVVFMRMFYMWWTSNIPPALGMLPLVAQARSSQAHSPLSLFGDGS